MELNKWNDFLSKWARAVSAYGTPPDFVVGAHVEKRSFEIWGMPLEIRVLISKNNALRRELGEKQKPYVPQGKLEDYTVHLDFDRCFLCQNVVQAFDSQDNPSVPNNVISVEGDYFIFPNKFPAFIGHSLFIPKDHDDTSARITPVTIEEAGKKRIVYPIEQGKTAGALLTKDYLAALIETCDEHSLVGLNNHVRDGMSIPGHKHFHLYPCDIDLFGGTPTRYRFKGDGIGEMQDTPFSTLAFIINHPNQETKIERAAGVLQRMEKANEVFTLVYHHNVLFISPRKNVSAGERIQLGAAVPVHFFGDVEGKQETIEKYVPLKGEYNWKRFID